MNIEVKERKKQIDRGTKKIFEELKIKGENK